MTKEFSRRQFLLGCSAVGVTALASSITDLQMIGALSVAEAQTASDYKALVCIFMYGGNDGSNTIIPTSTAEYNQYASGRTNLALSQGSLLSINPLNSAGRSYGLHPNLPKLRQLFNSGKAAALCNVGPLLAPTTRSDYVNQTVALPPQLFSHHDQSIHWQTSIPDQSPTTGWGGRVADIVNSLNVNAPVSMSVSLHPWGSNTFQVGRSIPIHSISDQGPVSLGGYGDAPRGGGSAEERARFNALRDTLRRTRSNLFENAYGKLLDESIDKSRILASALSNAPALTTIFPDTRLGRQLKMAARLISARGALGLKRQTFFCSSEGYDTHDTQLAQHADALADLDNSLDAFYRATVELGIANQVTTFTASDFGRTLSSNGKGSDHGWGGHHFILGGSVKGQRLYGSFPEMVINGPNDSGQGRWIPTTSVDEYSATLASWFGVSNTDLDAIFPNLRRFSNRNLGFFI